MCRKGALDTDCDVWEPSLTGQAKNALISLSDVVFSALGKEQFNSENRIQVLAVARPWGFKSPFRTNYLAFSSYLLSEKRSEIFPDLCCGLLQSLDEVLAGQGGIALHHLRLFPSTQ